MGSEMCIRDRFSRGHVVVFLSLSIPTSRARARNDRSRQSPIQVAPDRSHRRTPIDHHHHHRVRGHDARASFTFQKFKCIQISKKAPTDAFDSNACMNECMKTCASLHPRVVATTNASSRESRPLVPSSSRRRRRRLVPARRPPRLVVATRTDAFFVFVLLVLLLLRPPRRRRRADDDEGSSSR